MKPLAFLAVMLLLGQVSAVGKQKVLTSDPLTALPLFPATDFGFGNQPTNLPDGTVCASKMHGNFYMVNKSKVSATVAWYVAHLAGFKKISGYAFGRSQTALYNAAGTLLVSITGEPAAAGADADVYSVAYESFEPGLAEKAINGLTTGNIDCRR
jgi:hypothetical protein